MAKKTTHSGLHEFSGDESSNLFLGQRGFKLIGAGTAQTKTCGEGGDFTDIQYFVALKAVDVDCEVEARTFAGAQGDDLTTNSGSVGTIGDNPVTLGNGDIVYGCFDKVWVKEDDYIIAYIGK